MRRTHVALLLAFAVAVVLAALWYSQRPVSVTTVVPVRGDAAEIVYANGAVEPRYWANVTSLVRERIVEHCDCEGATVARGDVLARLNTSEASAVLKELEARRQLAANEVVRLEKLVKSDAAGRQALDQARTEAARIEALIAAQQARLENHVIRAPGPGVVLWETGEVGEIAEPGQTLFRVGKPDPRVVIAEVNEEDIPLVEQGQTALLRSDAFPGREFEARVDNITPLGDALAKSYRVRFTLPDKSELMLGMSVDVNIIVRVSENALLVPSPAFEKDRIFVVENGVAKSQRVETGIRGIERIEVLHGLTENSRIISPYPTDIEDGDPVRTVAD